MRGGGWLVLGGGTAILCLTVTGWGAAKRLTFPLQLLPITSRILKTASVKNKTLNWICTVLSAQYQMYDDEILQMTWTLQTTQWSLDVHRLLNFANFFNSYSKKMFSSWYIANIGYYFFWFGGVLRHKQCKLGLLIVLRGRGGGGGFVCPSSEKTFNFMLVDTHQPGWILL